MLWLWFRLSRDAPLGHPGAHRWRRNPVIALPRWPSALPRNDAALEKQMSNLRAREQTNGQAHKNADAARAGVEKLADFRQRATEDGWKSMQSSVDAASQGFLECF